MPYRGWCLAFSLLAGAAPAPDARVDYTLAPVMADGALASLAVEMRFRGDADGETRLHLPDEWAGSAGLWKAVSDLTIEGASVAPDGDAARRLRHAPNAPLIVRYRIAPAALAEPGPDFEKARPVVRPDWFFFHGEGVFAAPGDRQASPARFAWKGWPADWKLASDLDHLAGRAGTVGDVVESAALGAPDLRTVERTVDGARLRVAMRGDFGFDAAAFADRLVPIMTAQNAYWGDRGRAFFVPVAPLATDGNGRSTHGTGRTDAFAIASTTNFKLDEATRLLAHEYMHNWIAREIGGLAAANQAEGYWLTEGFTDFLAARTLIRAGLWSLEDYVAEKNEVLFRLAASPAHALPNKAIGERFWTDPDAQQLPYDRGNIFALWVDERRRGQGGLDAVLRTQRKLAQRAGKTSAASLFPAAAGAHVTAALDPHIERGEPVILPATLGEGCLRVETVPRALFDRGFDIDATLAAGRIVAGVDPAGAAFAAGLRDGMKLGRREAGEIGNPGVELAYRVTDASGERVIRYRPVSPRPVQVQQLNLPNLTPAQRAACAKKP